MGLFHKRGIVKGGAFEMNTTEQAIKRLALDFFHGKCEQYAKADTEVTLREALADLLDVKAYKNFRRAMQHEGHKVFAVMEDVLDDLLQEGIEDQFETFVDYKSVGIGDRPVFMVDDYHLFNVAVIAAGTNNLRRQKLDRQAFYVDTAYRGVKIYAEMEEYLSGKMDFAKMIARIQRSFNAQLGKDIHDAIVAGYNALGAPYKVTGSFSLTAFNELVQHVEAATGVKAMVLGTRSALQKVAPANLAYNGQVIERRNEIGFYTMIDGTMLYEIKQSHVPGTDTFAIGEYLLVVPQGQEKIVKVVLEGDAMIEDNMSGAYRNMDQSLEYTFMKKYGVGVVTSSRYGVMTLS